jgi:hypothetical protein
LDFDTTNGNGRSPDTGFPDFSTGSGDRSDRRRQQTSGIESAAADFQIPAGSRKSALVYLGLAAYRAGKLDPKELGEVRGRDVDEAGLQRALYRSSVGEIEHILGPILKGRKVVVEGHLAGAGRTALERLGAEVEELQLEDEKRYIDMTPAIFVFAAVAMAVRYISLGLDDQDLYILAGIGFALMYGLRPFFSKMQRPRE